MVDPTVIADGASPGDPMLSSVGALELDAPSPSLPAAITTTMPAWTAFSTAMASGSHGTPLGLPQMEPVSSGPEKAGPPSDTEATSIPSLSASSSASMMAASDAPS